MSDKRSRIASLLAKAADTAASESEAIAALNLADKLMEKHGLTLADIEGTDAQQVEVIDGVELRGRMAIAFKYFTHPLANFCHVSQFQTRRGSENWKMQWIGYPSDVDLADYLYAIIARSIMTESRRYIPTSLRNVGRQRDDFAAAMALRIGDRLRSMIIERPVPESLPSGALIPIRNSAIKEFEEKLDIKPARKTKPRTVDPSAAHAGEMAGDAVSLSKPVSQKPRPLLIEKQTTATNSLKRNSA